MAESNKSEDLNSILFIIERYPDGIGLKSLLEISDLNLSSRTLQRRLNQLIASGRVEKHGKGRAVRYRVNTTHVKSKIDTQTEFGSEYESYITLSAEGRRIRDHVRQSRLNRTPTGYHHQFLESYYPNKSFYLTNEICQQLATIGAPPETNRLTGTFARDIMNRLLIDLSWASSRLEGNTYNRLDTERLIEFGQAAEGKDALETQMILNHKSAIEFLINEIDLIDLSPFTIFSLHALLSDGLLADPSASGRKRINQNVNPFRPAPDA